MPKWKSKLLNAFNPTLAVAIIEAERVRTALGQPKSRSAMIFTNISVSALKDAYLQRKPVVWTSLLVPSELIITAGAIPFCPEIISSNLAWLGLENICLLESERIGISPAVCTSHRTAVGAISLDFLPVPDALVCTTELCDANVSAFRHASTRYDKPLFTLDIPSDRDASARGYLAFQLGQLMEFLANAVETRFNRESLAETVEQSNRARAALVRMNELRKVVSLPGGEAIGLFAMAPHFGRPKLANFLDVLCEEMSNPPKVAGSPRLLWLNVKPHATTAVSERIKRQGASVVFEEANQVYWPELDPSRPLTSLASKLLSHYIHAPIEDRVGRLLDLANEYQVNGVISLAYPRCRYGTAALPYILNQLSRAGIPSLSLDDDLASTAHHRSSDASTLDDFIETLRRAA
ncbi:MAG: 2-hydroxyacyl-CoA dehydratase family protein [Actinobacteria bacterium]|nr:2-hydroxyacyl-CoA dehydratase family protein [Actinomycetota bacterium]